MRMKTPTPVQIRRMVDAWEKRTIEFKAREAIGDPGMMPHQALERKDSELAKDIASFANTSGGYLIIGVTDKTRKIHGCVMSDGLKNRVSRVLRGRINPVPAYEIESVRVGRREITVFVIEEGEGDLCTVNGTVYLRDVNGRAEATGAEITRLVRRRLGKKVTATPTKRELVSSPYNLPTEEERWAAMNADFLQIDRKLHFKSITCVRRAYPRIRFASKCEADHMWHFFVIPFGDNFGSNEWTAIRWIASDSNGHERLRKRIKALTASDVINLLVLVMGRVNSLRSILQYSGLSYVPTPFGGYVAPGQGLYQTFFLSGVTHGELMKERLQDFLVWLVASRGWLAPRRRSNSGSVVTNEA